MKKSVLYYPFIRVPKSDWLTRMLLYWDDVRTIVPYEFLQVPERLVNIPKDLSRKDWLYLSIQGEYIHVLEGLRGMSS